MRWAQLHDRLNILWNCLSFGLEWKLTFSITVATAEFSKFADILNAALLQSHSLGCFKQLSWNSITSTSFACSDAKAHLTSCSSIPGFTWVNPTSYLSGSLWPFWYSSSVHSCYLFLISSAHLLGLWIFCTLLCPSLHEVFLWYIQFSWRDLYSLQFIIFL